MLNCKIRYLGEEPFKIKDRIWVYQGMDINVDGDLAGMLIKKYGEENFTVMRDPHGLLGEPVPVGKTNEQLAKATQAIRGKKKVAKKDGS